MSIQFPTSRRRVVVTLPLLLGLRDGGDATEWGRIRSALLRTSHPMAWMLLAANIAATVATAMLIRTSVPPWEIAAWSVMLVAIAIGITVRHRAPPRSYDADATARDLRNTGWEGLLLALGWSAVPVLFCTHAPSGTTAGLGIILCAIMTAAAFAMAPRLLATLMFLGCLSAAMIIWSVLAGAGAAAIALFIVTLLLMLICTSRARTLVLLHCRDIALDDRDETVSLLLREFDGTAADWLWETDAARRIVKASPRFALAAGLDPAAIDGMPLLQLLAGPTWETGNFAAGLRTLAEKMKARESFRDLRLPVQIAGEERWWEITASPRFDDRGAFNGFRGVGCDVTEQRASADKINRMARFDTLTGLPNRLMVNETLGRTISEASKWGSRYAFMMLDLDRFKAVNDTLGHPIGDRLLGHVSERLNRLVSGNDLCGRLGGDEFAIVIRDVDDMAALETLAQRIIDSLSRPYELDAHTLHIGASIGLAIGPRDGRTADMLVHSADLALYRAKDAGRGVFRTYEPELHAQAEERRALERALRSAVDNGEMHLVYHPVVDTDTGTLRGFEALVRWNSPIFGAVPPTKFIALAEDARLIGAIGAWVLRTACEEAARWPPHIHVAVNLSPDQLRNPGFITTVTGALASAGLPAARLELDVTEEAFLQEGTGVTSMLERLIDLGIRLSLDDFGAGASSLGYLSRARFSSVKIDRSVVREAAQGTREAIAIIRAVVALAQSLGMTTTAEGVETLAEHQMAQHFGLTTVQGYYFARPLPVEEARALATQGWKVAAA